MMHGAIILTVVGLFLWGVYSNLFSSKAKAREAQKLADLLEVWNDGVCKQTGLRWKFVGKRENFDYGYLCDYVYASKRFSFVIGYSEAERLKLPSVEVIYEKEDSSAKKQSSA